MAALFSSPPSPPKPPPPPSPAVDPSVEQNAQNQIAARRGLSQTVLTSPEGVLGYDQTAQRKTLLGSS